MNDSLVIIPTFNEKENIRAIIDAVMGQEKAFDVLVVDDNSPDGTAGLVGESKKKYGNRVQLLVRREKSGLGTAYIAGFEYALAKGYEYIFEMDADFSHNPADLIRLYNTCAGEGFDMVVGSRYATGVNVVNWPIGRVLLSYFASRYVQFMTGMPIKDSTAGFICYKRKVLETIPLDRIRFIGYAFQIEMKFTAIKYGFKVKEIPIIFTNRTLGTSKMSTRIFSEAFFGVILMKWRSLWKSYKTEEKRKSVEA